MTTVTIDTLKLSDRLETAGFSRIQAEAVVRAIAEAQDELVTKKDLEISLSSIRTDLTVLKWMFSTLLAGVAALVIKAFFG